MAAKSNDFLADIGTVSKQGNFAKQVRRLDRDVEFRKRLLNAACESRLVRLHYFWRAAGNRIELLGNLPTVVSQVRRQRDAFFRAHFGNGRECLANDGLDNWPIFARVV